MMWLLLFLVLLVLIVIAEIAVAPSPAVLDPWYDVYGRQWVCEGETWRCLETGQRITADAFNERVCRDFYRIAAPPGVEHPDVEHPDGEDHAPILPVPSGGESRNASRKRSSLP